LESISYLILLNFIVKFQLVNGLSNPIDGMDKSFREQIWVKTVKACLSKTKYNNL